ncbi:MAG: ACT domain-containing protein [Clostridiales bacterium]
MNYVNAIKVAEARGEAVGESKEQDAGHFPGLIRVKVYAGERVYRYCGTIFGLDDPRIVEIDGYRFDFRPEPNMILVENVNKPGMIGKIGTAMGENNINISAMQVCPGGDNEVAMMTFGVSRPPSDEQLANIAALEDVLKVRFVEF